MLISIEATGEIILKISQHQKKLQGEQLFDDFT